MIFYPHKCIDGEVSLSIPFRECPVGERAQGMNADGRPGAVFLNLVGEIGYARYSIRVPEREFRWYRGKVIFRPESESSQGVSYFVKEC